MPLPTFQDVQRAAALLTGIANNTPIHTSRQLNEISRATVFLKCENFQRVGAFKFRGSIRQASGGAVFRESCARHWASDLNGFSQVRCLMLNHKASYPIEPDARIVLQHVI